MSTLFRNIVQQVTQEKLEELKIQQELSKNYFDPVLKQVDQPSTPPTAALQVLYKALVECPLKDIVDSTLLENLKYVLQNEIEDPSISSQLVLAWVDKVKKEIEFSLRKFEYSYLYGSLLSEWLEAEELKSYKSIAEVGKSMDPKNSIEEEAALNKERARDSLKELMFNQPSTGFSTENFKNFLSEDVFNFDKNIEGQNVMKSIQSETSSYFNPNQFVVSTYDVQCCIKGLQSRDLLSLEKKSALHELRENTEALAEVASLLTNRLKNLNRWEWPSSSGLVEVRRGIAGVYKSYLNEDIITALFLQYVGVQWASYFKRQFLSIYRSKAWTKTFSFYHSIESQRRNFYESTFLSTLPNSMSSQESKSQEEYVRLESDEFSERTSGLTTLSVPQAMSMTYNKSTAVPGRSEAGYRVAGVGASHPGVGASSPGVGASSPGVGASYPVASASYPVASASYPVASASYSVVSASYPGASPSYPGAGASYPDLGAGYPAGGGSYPPGYPSGGYGYPQGSSNYPGHVVYYRPPTNTPKIDFKQAFLHTLSTEIRLSQVIHPDEPLVIVRADLESFGPNIAHDAVLTVFEYFGVPVQWIEFFKKFLQPKVSFGKDEEPKKVVRGVPTSHVLSSLFEETLLFLLDFYVNQQCNGMKIYRLNNEFWFWSNTTTSVNKAWNMMTKYGEVIGLKINENRSGSVTVYSDDVLSKIEKPIEFTVNGPSPLPQKNIHWGYLQLYSNGTFVIDQKSINKFVEEMQGLLDESECALEWINIFNKYLEFFIRNFGKSALVSGKQHLDQIIDSLRVIYEGLFGSKDGSPVDKLKERFEQLKAANIVDVWAYWPLERGGLGLVNPFIGIMSLRETYVNINDDDNFSKLPLQDKDLWELMKKEHERQYNGFPHKMPTWTEYIATRETELSHWCSRYLRLLERPAPKTPTVSDRFWKLDAPIPEEEYEKNYLMWLFSYYETQLILHFGSVKFINSKLLPMSMIGNIQKTKLHQ